MQIHTHSKFAGAGAPHPASTPRLQTRQRPRRAASEALEESRQRLRLEALEDVLLFVVEAPPVVAALVLVLVKVARVCGARDLGDIRRLLALLEHLRPVGRLEEGRARDVAVATLERAESLARVGDKQLGDELTRALADERRVAHLVAEDLLINVHRVVGAKGRLADEHLKDQDAECPPVDGEVVALVGDDLGREVLGRAAERPRTVGDDLGETKVDDLEVTVRAL